MDTMLIEYIDYSIYITLFCGLSRSKCSAYNRMTAAYS